MYIFFVIFVSQHIHGIWSGFSVENIITRKSLIVSVLVLRANILNEFALVTCD